MVIAFWVGPLAVLFPDPPSDLVFDCQFSGGAGVQAHKTHIKDDGVGVNETDVSDASGGYTRVYTKNETRPDGEGYYRRTKSDVSWGRTTFTTTSAESVDKSINRESGVITVTVVSNGSGATETGQCRDDARP